MLKLCITGVHGSGKTTLTEKLHTICRRRGQKVCVVTEVADRCPHPLNERSSTTAQKWIWREQMFAELQAQAAHPDVLICDRSLMDNLCYLEMIDHPAANIALITRYKLTQAWMKSQYDYVCRLPLNEEWLKSGNNSNRSPDIDFARAIDCVMDRFVQPHVNIDEPGIVAICKGNQA